MLRKSLRRLQAARENFDKSINRPKTEVHTSWGNDERYGQKQIRSGDPDPMIATAIKAAPAYSPKILKARIISSNGKVLFVTTMCGMALYLAWPTLRRHDGETKELSRLRLEGADTMAEHSTRWWANQWRKGAVEWRAGEADSDFHDNNFKWIREHTGRDMLSPPVIPLTKAEKAIPVAKHRKGMMKALVPLCGDSPIVKVLAQKGYFVHGIDSSEIAMQSLAKQMKQLPKEIAWNLKLHWTDFFNPDLWSVTSQGLTAAQKTQRLANAPKIETTYATDHTVETNMLVMPDLEEGLKGETFDFIYDRQALSAFHPNNRTDYSFMLKKALKDDGILFVEGIFRTGRVKGNKVKGPPYGVSEKQLAELFPPEEGFQVKCDNSIPDRIFSLDKANRILGSIPKELYSTPMPCVIWKPSKQRSTK